MHNIIWKIFIISVNTASWNGDYFTQGPAYSCSEKTFGKDILVCLKLTTIDKEENRNDFYPH